MHTWSVRLTYSEGYGDGIINQTYYVYAENDIEAIDKALNSFYSEFGLNFDDDIENIDWEYCRVSNYF